MANTEGLSDSAVESMLSSTLIDDSRKKRQNEILRQRMEMPMGDRPAATVVRRYDKAAAAGVSNNDGDKNQQQLPRGVDDQDRNEALDRNAPTSSTDPPPVVLGGIVERRPQRRRRRQRNTGSSTSASVKPSAEESRVSSISHSSNSSQTQRGASLTKTPTGIPSITDAPLGTFVKPRQKPAGARHTTNNHQDHRPSPIPAKTANGAAGSGKDFATMQQHSSVDAQAMLDQMSSNEIAENVQELEASLSPDTIAFLKNRRRQLNNHTTNQQPTTATTMRPTPDTASAPSTTKDDTNAQQLDGPVDAVTEKVRVAKLLSSITTYEDLDQAYRSEMGDASVVGPGDCSGVDIKEDSDELTVACELLRSTAPRQNLWAARVIAHRLSDDLRMGKLCSLTDDAASSVSQWPYPLMLPVSLRCLLDASVAHGNGYVLHTYVLQSLHSLLRLRASPDHFLDIADPLLSDGNESSLYQMYFLNDAVPTLPSGAVYASQAVQPIYSNEEQKSNKQNPAAFYASSASSNSAQADAEAFARDPMWTLLSRMRIIPYLAQLMRSTATSSLILPSEALVAVCGILSLVAQRSPGAGSAIAQHSSLLSDLVDATLVPRDGSPRLEPGTALPCIKLLSVLARQSRAAAEALVPIEAAVVSPILANKAQSDMEFQLQQWALIFWRTLLRYGLSLSSLQSILSIAAIHLTLDAERRYSLSADLLSAFTIVVHCSRIAQRRSEKEDPRERISEEQRNILANASVWLSTSTLRQALSHLDLDPVRSSDEEPRTLASRMRFRSSCLRFVGAFIAMTRERTTTSSSSDGEIRSESEGLSHAEEEELVTTLLTLVTSAEFDKAMDEFLPYAYTISKRTVPTSSKSSLSWEASACVLIDSLLTLVAMLGSPPTSFSEDLAKSYEKLTGALSDVLMQKLQSVVVIQTPTTCAEQKQRLGRARWGWLDRASCSIVKYLATLQTSPMMQFKRPLAFCVVARLQRGDEGIAAVVLSYDSLFLVDPAVQSSSLSSMFVSELCRTPQARSQLDHSFKLQNGPGITAEELGAFDLQSLLSEAEGSRLPNGSEQLLLPLGGPWLWRVVSGTVVQDHQSKNAHNEVSIILLESLRLMTELETSDCVYANSVQRGEKAYHLMNIGLFPEEIVCKGDMLPTADELLASYTDCVNKSFVVSFIDACRAHSSLKHQDSKAMTDSSLTKDERKAASLLLKKDHEAIRDFASEMCDVFMEYGAQYPFYTKCLRLFLLPVFPSNLRCHVIQRLSGVLHLLVLDDDMEQISLLLKPYLDTSMVEPAEYLDTLSSVFTKGSRNIADRGFVFFLGTAVLARSLAISLQQQSSTGLSVWRRRLMSCDWCFAAVVLETAIEFSKTDRTEKELVSNAVATAKSSSLTTEFSDIASSGGWNETVWHHAVAAFEHRSDGQE